MSKRNYIEWARRGGPPLPRILKRPQIAFPPEGARYQKLKS